MSRFRFPKLDARENFFFERALEYVETQIYENKERDLTARSLVPKIEGIDPAAATYTWREYTRFGMAKIVASYADDFPRADVAGSENTSVIKSLGSSYGYNVMEIRQARKAGSPLQQARANSAARAIDELMDELIAQGSVEHNMVGLVNQPNATIYTVAQNAAANHTEWPFKTGPEIVKDLIGIQLAQIILTNNAEKPNTIVLDLISYSYISTTPYNPDGTSEKTILQVFLSVSPYVKTVIPWLNLATAGAGGTRRMICYRRAIDALGAIIPQEMETFDPQPDGMEFVVDCHARCGGVIAYYPLSISYGDGI